MTEDVSSFREMAMATIKANHYSQSVPAGKSHYVEGPGGSIVVWSIPANKNIGKFLLGWSCNCWELSRLWAPDGHEPNLLTRAIAEGVRKIRDMENPDVLVSYADPNVGHTGGVYRAASWIFTGQSEESRLYRSPDGVIVARRAFHSGRRCLTKAEILALGYTEAKAPGKLRFARPMTRSARRTLTRRFPNGGM